MPAIIGTLEMPRLPTPALKPERNLTLHGRLRSTAPVGCGDAPSFPGDIWWATIDCGGSSSLQILPRRSGRRLFEMTAYEDFVCFEEVKGGAGIIGL